MRSQVAASSSGRAQRISSLCIPLVELHGAAGFVFEVGAEFPGAAILGDLEEEAVVAFLEVDGHPVRFGGVTSARQACVDALPVQPDDCSVIRAVDEIALLSFFRTKIGESVSGDVLPLAEETGEAHSVLRHDGQVGGSHDSLPGHFSVSSIV